MIKKEYSRLEVNKMVRTTLQRHNVDLSQLQYSSSTRSVHFTGILQKGAGKDFVAKEIEYLWYDLTSLPGVREIVFNVENWDISAGSITCFGGRQQDDDSEISSSSGNGEGGSSSGPALPNRVDIKEEN